MAGCGRWDGKAEELGEGYIFCDALFLAWSVVCFVLVAIEDLRKLLVEYRQNEVLDID